MEKILRKLNTSLFDEDNKLLETYNEIWEKLSNSKRMQ